MTEKYGWCKDLPVVDYKDEEGKEYCVFHTLEGKKGIYAKEFNELIFERINFAIRKKQLCDLSGTIFEWDIGFGQFNEYNPLPPISFIRANFIGKSDFSYSVCSGILWFREVTFHCEAYFRHVVFKEEANFIFARFKEQVDFTSAKFDGKPDFTQASFNEESYFLDVTFSEVANFGDALFHQGGYFGGATFEGKTVFFGRTFDERGGFANLNIKDKIIFDGANLRDVSFLYTDLRKIDFINCTWPKKFGRDIIYDELRFFGDVNIVRYRFTGNILQILRQEWDGFKEDIAPDKEMIKKVEILYRMLKQKYKEEHNDYEVANWHYGEKEMFRKGSYFRRFFPLSLSNLYWLSSGYGERPVRAGIVLIFLIFMLSILTAMSGLKPPEGGFAAIILNTLQYATLQKATLLEPASLTGGYLKLLTQILIPLQTALFALALKNRFKR